MCNVCFNKNLQIFLLHHCIQCLTSIFHYSRHCPFTDSILERQTYETLSYVKQLYESVNKLLINPCIAGDNSIQFTTSTNKFSNLLPKNAMWLIVFPSALNSIGDECLASQSMAKQVPKLVRTPLYPTCGTVWTVQHLQHSIHEQYSRMPLEWVVEKSTALSTQFCEPLLNAFAFAAIKEVGAKFLLHRTINHTVHKRQPFSTVDMDWMCMRIGIVC